ncbi:SLATT domain-containing protein [Rathayibacter festucae]|uniref:SLATT domain-containing protein n=1 Tax=Rathayibacter festucae TaxID=110937 RepID=A0ABX6H4I6_9MICO|nr:SLATT domain-containing protein [Rathayibacter festucae]
MSDQSEPSGIDSVGPPPAGSTPAETVEHYLSGYEAEFKKARRTVKRRSSAVTIAASVLTGLVAVLGCISAVLATDWISGGVAVGTTLSSATIAVLLAWNEHFHHRELWIQRSAVLADVNSVRRRFAARSARPWYKRRTEAVDSKEALDELDSILKDDIRTWTSIQGN